MSKLYKEYISLKIKNNQKLYLFKSGLFYIFLDEDAKIISKELGLKLTPLNSIIMKCGFPEKSKEKYLSLLKNLGYEVEIVESNSITPKTYTIDELKSNEKLSQLIDSIANLDIENTSISYAFDFLTKIQKECKEIKEGINNNEKNR
jgi:DNA mismatch repair ATPase MutS